MRSRVAKLTMVTLTTFLIAGWFVGCVKNSDSLPKGDMLEWTEELQTVIIQDYFQSMSDNPDNKFAQEDIYIYKYCGIYDKNVAIVLALHNNSLPPKIDTIEIAGFEFLFNTGLHITVWREGCFYSLQSAYDKRYLTLENIEKIHVLHETY